jgi:hypothetical protein
MQLELFNTNEHDSVHYVRGPRAIRKFSSLKQGVPRLVIEGKWLTKLGVRVGDLVNIQYHQNMIIISWNSPEKYTQSRDK